MTEKVTWDTVMAKLEKMLKREEDRFKNPKAMDDFTAYATAARLGVIKELVNWMAERK